MQPYVLEHHVEFRAGQSGHDVLDGVEIITSVQIIENIQHGDPRCRKLGSPAIINDLNRFGPHRINSNGKNIIMDASDVFYRTPLLNYRPVACGTRGSFRALIAGNSYWS